MSGKTETARRAEARKEAAKSKGATDAEAEQAAWKLQNVEAKPGDKPKRHEGRSGKKAGSGRGD